MTRRRWRKRRPSVACVSSANVSPWARYPAQPASRWKLPPAPPATTSWPALPAPPRRAAVVAGHHAGDQTETILLHLLRGAGLGGLRGMAAAAPLPGSPDLWLLRPLLGVERAAIEAYCAAAGLRPTLDASNADPSFTRNRLRHELLPLLATYNPRIAQQLRETGAIAAAEDELLSALAEVAWRQIALPSPPGQAALRRAEWRRQPLALRRRLLRRAIAVCLPTLADVGFQAIEAARRAAEGEGDRRPGVVAGRRGHGGGLRGVGRSIAARSRSPGPIGRN